MTTWKKEDYFNHALMDFLKPSPKRESEAITEHIGQKSSVYPNFIVFTVQYLS